MAGMALAVFGLQLSTAAQQPVRNGEGSVGQEPGLQLVPTNHPRLPRDLSLLWLVPGAQPAAPPTSSREFAAARMLVVKGEYSKALSMLTRPALQQGPLGRYAELYAGLVEQALGRHAVARKIFRDLQDRRPIGYLSE